MVTYPTPHEVDLISAFLGGYVEEGNITAITRPEAVEIASRPVKGVTIDGQIASRILRRCGFNRSYLPADAGVITYRKTPRG